MSYLFPPRYDRFVKVNVIKMPSFEQTFRFENAYDDFDDFTDGDCEECLHIEELCIVCNEQRDIWNAAMCDEIDHHWECMYGAKYILAKQGVCIDCYEKVLLQTKLRRQEQEIREWLAEENQA